MESGWQRHWEGTQCAWFPLAVAGSGPAATMFSLSGRRTAVFSSPSLETDKENRCSKWHLTRIAPRGVSLCTFDYACALNFVGTLFYIFSLLKCLLNGLFKPVERQLNKTLPIKWPNDASWSSLQNLYIFFEFQLAFLLKGLSWCPV